MWTYSGNPLHSAIDAVRFLIGDTNHCEQLLQDGEIAWVLSLYNNVPNNAAIRCCEAIMSKFSRMCDETVGSVSMSFSQRAKAYREMRDDLTRRLAIEDMVPFAGGISVVANDLNVLNADRVKPDFSKQMMENEQIAPWVTSQNNRPLGPTE